MTRANEYAMAVSMILNAVVDEHRTAVYELLEEATATVGFNEVGKLCESIGFWFCTHHARFGMGDANDVTPDGYKDIAVNALGYHVFECVAA